MEQTGNFTTFGSRYRHLPISALFGSDHITAEGTKFGVGLDLEIRPHRQVQKSSRSSSAKGQSRYRISVGCLSSVGGVARNCPGHL